MLEGEFCEALAKSEGKTGTYDGHLLAELPKGDLNWTAPLVQSSDFATPSFGKPYDIAAGPEGNLWFTDAYRSKIGEFNPVTHATSEYPIPAKESEPEHLAVGPEGDIWFTGREANRIAEINPITHVASDFPTPTEVSYPLGITAGADGSIWFTEAYPSKIGEINIGGAPASLAAPAIVGGGQAGAHQTCAGAQWVSFAFQQPLEDAFPFDGYQWLLNGSPIAEQTSDSYTPSAGEDGDALTCSETVTYPITGVSAVASSPGVTVNP